MVKYFALNAKDTFMVESASCLVKLTYNFKHVSCKKVKVILHCFRN